MLCRIYVRICGVKAGLMPILYPRTNTIYFSYILSKIVKDELYSLRGGAHMVTWTEPGQTNA